ncbi:MAG: DNA polymerase III subunit alpha [Holosporales bacterium]|jgi:DNA polymerase-3 subunit alpha|nr:DNA polymerase III subunit alpha [Holosporales bacterium]
MNPFIHLRVHSAYSLCEGAVKMDELVRRCEKLQAPAVAITDTNNMFGVIEFSLKCASHGIQPIPSTSLNLSVHGTTSPIILLAQNERGYKNLLKLMTCFYIENRETEAITLENLTRYNDGMIALSGGARGVAGTLFLGHEVDKAAGVLRELHTIFQDRFYIEISRTGEPEENETESFFVDFVMQNDIPLVATNEVFFLDKSMHAAHDALLCIADGTYLTSENRRRVTTEHYLKTSDEMFDLFGDIKEAVTNTSVIAQRCSFFPEKRSPVFPKFANITTDEEAETLEKQAYEGLAWRMGSNQSSDSVDSEIPEAYMERLRYELSLIKSTGFSGYFLVVSDFVRWAKDNGIPVGPGRGSGAGSIVAWSLNITDLDPIRYGLLFERFINPERVSLPDFDIDFCQDRRDEVIRYVQNRYGNERVAHIITFGKLQARAVIRDVGRVMQMPYGQVDKISKLVPQNAVNPVDLRQALAVEPQLRNMMETDDNVRALINTSLQLEGLYRHASLHAAGVVIGNDSIDTMVPLYHDGESELAITQINMKYIELAGLIKFDFLGLKTLTVIKHTCDLVREHRGIDLDISAIDLENENTFKLMCDVDVVGVFQLESAGMKDVIQKLKPDNIEDIIALVALYRPGPMDNIPTYISRKHGLEPVEYLHPILEPILKSTYGIMIYQEQVIKVAQEMGGFSPGAADILRRAMGKKIKEEMVKNQKIFVEGAKKNGVSADIAEQVFALVGKFAGYGFNRSHAAGYALISYQTAYLKANYKREFYIASMNIDITHSEKVSKFVQDARRAGINTLPPDINLSDECFTVEGDNSIRYALGSLKGCSPYAMRGIVLERMQNGKFKDIFDFFKRTKLCKISLRYAEILALSGAFDSIHSNRRQIVESLDQLMKLGDDEAKARQKSLFAEYPSCECELKDVLEWDVIEKLDNEMKAIGFYLSSHPMDIYSSLLHKFRITRSRDFKGYNGSVITAAGIIIAKQEKFSTKGGHQKYAFITVSDQDGAFDVTVFPKLYAEVMEIITVGTPVLVEAEVKQEAENTKLLGISVKSINSIMQKQKLHIHLDASADVDALCEILRSLADGDNQISIVIPNANGRMTEIDTKYKKAVTIADIERIAGMQGVRFA